jgi:hypothetical protein
MKRRGIKLLAAVLAVLAFGGCREKQDNGAEAKAVLRGTAIPGGSSRHRAEERQAASQPRLLRPASASSPAAGKAEMLDRMGIEVGNGRITIDTRRTRSYFEAMERQISRGVNRGVQKAKQHASGVDDIGIYVSKERVEIDLNKTRNFLKIWGESMRILGEELDRSLKNAP